ncbi:unnamed protein product [Brachionus calyciflorus]|uniref:Uncharacterized protein n=1 Tax=Brachionus calyciflorus TaxID=104777 RepID=A0A814NTN0_9BILA|nr:unnamed protein product [Brachionus calyciflorus]
MISYDQYIIHDVDFSHSNFIQVFYSVDDDMHDRSKKIKVEQQKFTRDKVNWNFKTNVITKLYGFVYDKRILLDDLSTIPFGYLKFELFWLYKEVFFSKRS